MDFSDIFLFRFEWIRTNLILGESEAEIRWYVPENMTPGKYRISHSGAWKPLLKKDPKHFVGYTNEFEVLYLIVKAIFL